MELAFGFFGRYGQWMVWDTFLRSYLMVQLVGLHAGPHGRQRYKCGSIIARFEAWGAMGNQPHAPDEGRPWSRRHYRKFDCLAQSMTSGRIR